MITATVLFLFNKDIAPLLSFSQWHGFSRWWAILPASLLFLYYLMRANYQKFQEEKDKADALLQEEKRKNEELQGKLSQFLGSRELKAEWNKLATKFKEFPSAMWLDWDYPSSKPSQKQFIVRGIAGKVDSLIVAIEEAGNLLLTSNYAQQVGPSSLSVTDSGDRWLDFIVETRNNLSDDFGDTGVPGQESHRIVKKMRNIASVCALVCEQLAAKEKSVP